jgi:hypothetical protein
MRKRLFVFLLGVIVSSATGFAQRPQKVIGPGIGSANFRVPFVQSAGSTRTLSRDTIYILTGWYFVDSTANLTIQSGTLILGDSASGGTLIVRRGGKVIASGTAAQPIVFTSGKAPGTRKPGDWGGVVVLGKAPTNQPSTKQIEGGFGTIPNTNAMYGGSEPDDSSGVLRYVRIEFAGIAFSTDNEINGLTFGGVGRKTVVDHIQVSFANDDDYEFFGGTLDAKYLVSWRSLDDNFDTDFGYSGRLQFLYAKRDPQVFDASASGSSNGFESDNEATAPYAATPRTSVRASNVSLIGPAVDSTVAATLNAKWDNSAMIRRASEFSLYNSVIAGWQKGINIRDTLTQRAALDGRLQIRNTSLAAPRNVVVASSSPNTGNIPGFDPVAWFTTGTNNRGGTARQAGDVGFTSSAFALNTTNDPVPSSTSELATAGAALDGRLAGDTWFTATTYRGAFNPALSRNQQWDWSWANYDPQNTIYVTDVKEVGGVVPTSFAVGQNYPNPFNPTTNIKFELPKNSFVTLKVYDLLGQEVVTLVNEQLPAGSFITNFNAANFSSGTYVYRMTANGVVQTRKMTLMK